MRHTAVRACTREHILVGNLGTRLIEAFRPILERQLAGSVEGSMMDASMDSVWMMQRRKQQEEIGRSCCKNGCGWVEQVGPGVGRSCSSSLTLERFGVEEKFDLEQERFRSSNSCIRP